MVSRMCDAIRRLIDDYGSDDEKMSPPKSKMFSKQSVKIETRKVVFRSPGKELNAKKSVESSFNSSTSSEDETIHNVNEENQLHKQLPVHKTESAQLNPQSISTTDFEKTNEGADEGRVRAFPHTPGQWATFVYFIPRIDGLMQLFHDLVTEAMIASHSRYKWTYLNEPHVSLSRTVTLRYHQVPSFTAHLKAEIVKSCTSRFSYKFENVGMFFNESSSTSFLALKVGLGAEEMLKLLKTVDGCLKSFNLQTFYENPEFHLSFAWCSGRVADEDRTAIISALQEKLEESHSEYSSELMQTAKALHCKSGNRTYLIPL